MLIENAPNTLKAWLLLFSLSVLHLVHSLHLTFVCICNSYMLPLHFLSTKVIHCNDSFRNVWFIEFLYFCFTCFSKCASCKCLYEFWIWIVSQKLFQLCNCNSLQLFNVSRLRSYECVSIFVNYCYWLMLYCARICHIMEHSSLGWIRHLWRWYHKLVPPIR